MANQINYPEPLQGVEFQRPDRVARSDAELLNTEKRQVIFGTTQNDVVEIWLYNPDGTLSGHVNLPYSDPALSIATVVTQDGPTEIITLDLKDIGNTIVLQPGRYSMVANLFRDEVGSESGYRLYISEISSDRTELRLSPVSSSVAVIQDVYNFVEPSVPKLYAKGLLDQVFGTAIEAPATEQISISEVYKRLDESIPDTSSRITTAGLQADADTLIKYVMTQAHQMALVNMAEDVFNFEVQYVEFEEYVQKALDSVIYNLVQTNQIDHRFEVR